MAINYDFGKVFIQALQNEENMKQRQAEQAESANRFKETIGLEKEKFAQDVLRQNEAVAFRNKETDYQHERQAQEDAIRRDEFGMKIEDQKADNLYRWGVLGETKRHNIATENNYTERYAKAQLSRWMLDYGKEESARRDMEAVSKFLYNAPGASPQIKQPTFLDSILAGLGGGRAAATQLSDQAVGVGAKDKSLTSQIAYHLGTVEKVKPFAAKYGGPGLFEGHLAQSEAYLTDLLSKLQTGKVKVDNKGFGGYTLEDEVLQAIHDIRSIRLPGNYMGAARIDMLTRESLAKKTKPQEPQ